MRMQAGIGVLLVVVIAACSSGGSTATHKANSTPIDLFATLDVRLPQIQSTALVREVRRIPHVEQVKYMTAADARRVIVNNVPGDPRTVRTRTLPLDAYPGTLTVRLDDHTKRNAVAARVRRLNGVEIVRVTPSCSSIRKRNAIAYPRKTLKGLSALQLRELRRIERDMLRKCI